MMLSTTRKSLLVAKALGIALSLTALYANAATELAPAVSAAAGVTPISAADGAPVNPANPYNGGVDPVTMPNDARMAVFTYSRDQIFRVMTAPLKTTTIEFDKGEQLVADPALGDSIRWSVDTDGANHLFIKPNQPGLVNTLHVSTNLREYDFTLVSSPLGGLFYQSVRFNYPKSLMDKVRQHQQVGGDAIAAGAGDNSGPIGVSPDKLDFDWTIDGDAAFKPETVFDDGKFVWLKIPDNAPWPVAIIRDHGDDVSPNTIRRGQFLEVQQMADKIILRAGHDEATVERGHHGLFGL